MSSPKPKLSSSSTAGSSPLVRKSSAEASSSTPAGVSRTSSGSSAGSAASPASAVKAGLKKLSVGSDAPDGTITPVRSSTGAPSPSNRTRLSPAVGTPAKSSAAPTTLSSPTAPRRATTTSTTSSSAASTSSAASSAAAAAHARTIMKAPVQSPTAAGMKMRPASGAGLNNLSSIGVSAMAAAAANPYSSSLSALSTQSPSPTQSSPSPQSANSAASASPNSPIASASPAARRYKTPTSSPTQQAQAASSPIHSISQSGASATKKYDNVYTGTQAAATVAAASSAHLHGANSYRANHVHPPVNTHTQVPQGHVADHNAPPNGATIFSPVYHRTASQEQLHQAEELKKKAAGGRTEAQQREDAEALYRQQQQAAAAQYAQQQAAAAAAAQAAAQAQALAHQQAQNKHTVSYTPPAVEEDEFDPFLFIKNLPPLSPAMRNRRSPLPKKLLSAPKITLALDLDETLVHCSVQPIERAELTFKVAFNGLDYEVFVRTRPHMKEFLETVSQWFEVMIFTASQKVYADKLLDILDPSKTLIKYRIFRDSCVCVDGNYLKDLHILGRELPTVAIVDNSVQAFGFQLDNGIPIESWFDDDNDRELLNLIPFLRTLKDVKDVRPLIRDTFRLTEFVASL